jgi:hypothetical protein
MMSVFYLWKVFVFFPIKIISEKLLEKKISIVNLTNFSYFPIFLPNFQYQKIGKRNPIQAKRNPSSK